MDYYGIGYSNIRLPNSSKNYIYRYNTRINTFPEEVFIHEFLHSLERTSKEYGYQIPALHDYAKYGYKLPKLIFWNVNSRTKTIPLIENELGVTLVSGFSQNVLQMVMSNKYDPYEVLVDTITRERYEKIKL